MSSAAWAGISDALLVATIIGYATAMIAHAAELVVPAETRALVPAGGVPAVTTALDLLPQRPRRNISPQVYGKAAVTLTVAATLLHLGCVLARAFAAARVPWGNMYEFILTVSLIGAITWLILLARRHIRPVGLFITLALAVTLGAAGRVHVRVTPLMPALASPWLRIHVAAAALATGLFLIGFVATALYLLRLRHDASPDRNPASVAARLPTAATLDRLAQRMHMIAFPIWTFAIVTGAIWAEAAWGRYWGWDPKEVWAFVSWVLYVCYLHARATAGWRGRPAALIACAAWASMMINVFAVNILMTGLHSYAGI